jgi:hypothetical protein
MNKGQNAVYWRKWGAAAAVQGWTSAEADRQRHAAHRVALGCDKSSKEIDNTQLSAVFRVFEALAEGVSLEELAANGSVIDAVERKEHCTIISRMAEYLMMLHAQRRLTAEEARKSADAYVAHIAHEALATVGDWRALPVRLNHTRKQFDAEHKGEAYQPPRGVDGRFDLENLRNIISSRLSAYITKVKKSNGTLLFGDTAEAPPNKAIMAHVVQAAVFSTPNHQTGDQNL